MTTEYTLTFEAAQERPGGGYDVIYGFPYHIVESKYLGKPDEKIHSTRQLLTVRASGSLVGHYTWRFDDENLVKVLFEYGHRCLAKQLQANSLAQKEELVLSTTYEGTVPCPYDPSRIQ